MLRQAPAHHSHLFRMKKGSLLQLVFVAAAIGILLPQIREFSSSWSYISKADLKWLLVGVICMSMTIVFASIVYITLVPKLLPFRRTMLIQLATYFTNRLLPSGLGGIGFNAMYLVKQTGLSRTESAVYATANNLIGFVAFGICIFISTFIADSAIKTELPIKEILVVVSALILICSGLSLFIKRVQKRLIDFIGHLFGVFLEMSKNPRRMILAVIASMGITASYVAVLWAACKSVGIDLSILDIFIAFVAGNAALTLSPTPGGIGAVEAALTSVIISASVEPSTALAAVILYRLVSYWMPILPGYISFRFVLRKQYI
jgi:uncharacterized protein (TIRG00374 family)